jgi:hypothetical protein
LKHIYIYNFVDVRTEETDEMDREKGSRGVGEGRLLGLRAMRDCFFSKSPLYKNGITFHAVFIQGYKKTLRGPPK